MTRQKLLEAYRERATRIQRRFLCCKVSFMVHFSGLTTCTATTDCTRVLDLFLLLCSMTSDFLLVITAFSYTSPKIVCYPIVVHWLRENPSTIFQDSRILPLKLILELVPLAKWLSLIPCWYLETKSSCVSFGKKKYNLIICVCVGMCLPRNLQCLI